MTRNFIPQGCDQQGRLKPTVQPLGVEGAWPADCTTDFGLHDDQTESAASDVARIITVFIGVILFTILCVSGIRYALTP